MRSEPDYKAMLAWANFCAQSDKTAAGKSRAEVRLYAGAGQWLLSLPRADGTCDLTPATAAGQQASPDAGGLLEQWLTAPRRGRNEGANDQARGFCPTVMERGRET